MLTMLTAVPPFLGKLVKQRSPKLQFEGEPMVLLNNCAATARVPPEVKKTHPKSHN
jgi:hypothetical protein